MKYFNPNRIVIKRVVSEENNRYKPQAYSHTTLFLKVVIHKIASIDPMIRKTIVNAKLILTIGV